MALIAKKQGGIETVGELIDSLSRFPRDMPVRSGLDYEIVVYHEKPQKGEVYDDKRGCINVEGDDGGWDD